MKRSGKTLIYVVSGLALGAGALTALAQDNPYEGIVARNLFGLKPPSPPAADPASATPPPPKIKLQGMTSILGRLMVMFKTPPPPARPGEPVKESSFTLSVGQREDDIEILEIDEQAQSVKLKNHDLIQLLTMDKDGEAPPASAPATPNAPPVVLGMGVPGGQQPPPMPGGQPAPAAAGQRTIPPRTLRLPTAAAANPAVQPPIISVPQPAVAQPMPTPTRTITPEEAIQTLINQANQAPTDMEFPPVPPMPQ